MWRDGGCRPQRWLEQRGYEQTLLMKRIAIIGGGTTGLAAAYELERQRRAGATLEYAVFDAAAQMGGVLVSERVDGCLVEAGPDSFITEKPWAAALCRELGLGGEIIGSNDNERRTFILVHNRMVEMPDGLMFMVPTRLLPTALTPLFSWPTKLRMGGELLRRPRELEGDESVAAFVARHFGDEVVDRLADPLLSGIYGADSDRLSVRAVLPRFIEMERRYGSLVRGMLAARRRMAEMMKGRPKPPLFSSLKQGMRQMVDVLLERLAPPALHTNEAVTGLAREGESWRIATARRSELFDAVIFCTPAHVAGALLATVDAALAQELIAISYSSSVTINLIFRRADIAGRDTGFGFLVPRSEGRRMLAGTFVHHKFPHRAAPERAIVRGFLGGLRDQQALELADDEIVAIIRRELREITGIAAEPLAVRVHRWNRAMSQPSPGHLERIARIEATVARLPGVALAGNYFRGIGVPDCVRTGQEAARRLGSPSAAPPAGARSAVLTAPEDKKTACRNR
jgi:oxygen-dependent protoporphyrinogen oxidase